MIGYTIGKTLRPKSDCIDPKARVAFMTASGGHKVGNLLEPALALALKRHNVETAVMLCDEAFQACNITEFGNQASALDTFLTGGPQATKTCTGCFETGFNTWSTTGVKIFMASNFITPVSSDNELDDISLGGADLPWNKLERTCDQCEFKVFV